MRVNPGDLVEMTCGWRGHWNGQRGIVLKNGRSWPCVTGCYELSIHGTSHIVMHKEVARVIRRRFVSKAALKHL